MKGFEQQQVYRDSCRLMRLAYDALFCMTNADRIAYGNDFKQYTSRMVALFVLAWGKRTNRSKVSHKTIKT